MILSDSIERSESRPVRVRQNAYWNGRMSSFSASPLLGRSSYLTVLMRTITNWKKKNRYVDTGESGETYDAEMAAAAFGIW
jgi:hypothetical protein